MTPAAGGQSPTRSRCARLNEDALLKVLAPYGVANGRLDEVSSYDRSNGSAGEVWRQPVAGAGAVVRNGVAARIVRTGAGNSSAPRVTIVGYPEVEGRATIACRTDLATNGSVSKLTLVKG